GPAVADNAQRPSLVRGQDDAVEHDDSVIASLDDFLDEGDLISNRPEDLPHRAVEVPLRPGQRDTVAGRSAVRLDDDGQAHLAGEVPRGMDVVGRPEEGGEVPREER